MVEPVTRLDYQILLKLPPPKLKLAGCTRPWLPSHFNHGISNLFRRFITTAPDMQLENISSYQEQILLKGNALSNSWTQGMVRNT